MTEKKRFEYKNHKVFDNLTGEEHSSNMVSVNVLNQLARVNREGVKKVQKLAKENEQLKHDATVLICSNQEYRKENEQLKHTVHKYSLQIIAQDNKIIELEKENEQLKKDNSELKEAMKRMAIEMMGGV